MLSDLEADMTYLQMSREECLASINSKSTIKFDKLVVGAHRDDTRT